MKIIHCADLHLSESEKAYSLGVLDEIVSVSAGQKADMVIFAGDTFDTFRDAETLRAEFRKRVSGLVCGILCLSGNHDIKDMGANSLDRLDLGANVQVLTKKPFELIERGGVEFLAIPFQPVLKDYVNWKVPVKITGRTRVAIAHGTVVDMDVYTGNDDSEDEDGAMDSDVFTRFQVDYAAMGHIHSGRSAHFASTDINYPGSARVWRRHESGKRGVNLVKLDDGVKIEFIPLASAGQYYYCQIPVGLDGHIERMPDDAQVWGRNDWVDIQFTGIVEDEISVRQTALAFKAEYGLAVRRMDVDHSLISVASGITAHALAKQFLAAWKKREPAQGDDKKVWLKARELGLAAIKEKMDL